MDMNTAGWEFDSELTAETHREMRANEFYGWALGQMKERRRLVPESHPAEYLLAMLSGAMTCGRDEKYSLPDHAYTILDFVEDQGWAVAVQLIGSAMRELERETV